MFGNLSKFILKMLGWKFTGEYPHHYKKFVLIVIPHTSSWDFPTGLLVRSSWKSDIKFVGKKTLFRFPFGGIFRWLGGYPVDRKRSQNFVDAVVDVFNEKEEFAICIAPEGTRKKVEKLKTGFYYIAKGAGIPIIPVKFDFEHKIIGIGEPIFPSDSKEADIEKIERFFRGVKGKVPENSYGYNLNEDIPKM
ncbi:MAG: acyltransferase [Bacteroidetes bacterium]|nr:acyltransferase [Bacteroidota bacterium]